MELERDGGGYPSDRCLHELIAEQAATHAGCGGGRLRGRAQLSYARAEPRSNQLAHHLRGLGVGPEVVVGLCVERSLEMVVGLLGILKAGGAYLPLDPSYPAERLAYMLADARVPVLVTQARLAGSTAAARGPCGRARCRLGRASRSEPETAPVNLTQAGATSPT